MSIATFTKAGVKATPVKLDSDVFGVDVKNQELLKLAYNSYLANGRQNLARALKRGEVRGGGKKPWKQKGTGRARFGSIRTPLWRGGGIIFGPTGQENYKITVPLKSKQLALKQALSLAVKADKLIVVEEFSNIGGKTKDFAKFLAKVGAKGRITCVIDPTHTGKAKGASNIAGLEVVQARLLSVYSVLNADFIVISKKALEILNSRLGGKK